MHLLSFVRRSTFGSSCVECTNKQLGENKQQTYQQPGALSDKRILNTCIFAFHTHKNDIPPVQQQQQHKKTEMQKTVASKFNANI